MPKAETAARGRNGEGRSPPEGFRHIQAALSHEAQSALLTDVVAGLAAAPAFQPTMPGTGAPLSVTMSNFGPLGWVADKSGYRYQPRHPITDEPWPAIPKTLLELYTAYAPEWPVPEACLINLYGAEAKMGAHVDADEDAKHAPVLSVSLGASARFRIGGPTRGGPTTSVIVASGDMVVMGGASRRCYHGVDRIIPPDPLFPPLADPRTAIGASVFRVNLTLRRVRLLTTS